MDRRSFTIRVAALPSDRERLLAAVHEYLVWLDLDLSNRGIDAELAEFDQRFTLPSGMFFLAETEGEVAGCAGFLRHPGDRAELKRLYVRPAFRGHGLGERLVEAVIDKTRAIGFSRLMLDAVPQTGFAMKLYERMGFAERGAFYDNPVPGTRFYEMALG